MKYLIMVLGKQADYDAMSGSPAPGQPAWTEKDIQAMYGHMGAINDSLAESGELVDAQGLTEPSQGRLVTAAKDGTPVVSDGPYGEAKEVIAGYWVVDVENIERATEIAARAYACPQPEGAPNYPVVVRPIGEMQGDEM
ncbi:YciI family protein [Streptomyces sp. NPDC057654]|uniref:YciI family protein n=1 Tax=Streptomyces sp. NPDC057654 TaxID=3346196 RepID=UPI0036ABA428